MLALLLIEELTLSVSYLYLIPTWNGYMLPFGTRSSKGAQQGTSRKFLASWGRKIVGDTYLNISCPFRTVPTVVAVDDLNPFDGICYAVVRSKPRITLILCVTEVPHTQSINRACVTINAKGSMVWFVGRWLGRCHRGQFFTYEVGVIDMLDKSQNCERFWNKKSIFVWIRVKEAQHRSKWPKIVRLAIWDPSGPLWDTDMPVMLGHFWPQNGPFLSILFAWTIPSKLLN